MQVTMNNVYFTEWIIWFVKKIKNEGIFEKLQDVKITTDINSEESMKKRTKICNIFRKIIQNI